MSDEERFELHPDADVACADAHRLYAAIARELKQVLPVSAEIRHIGATAVSGCLTKGDLDILVRVEAAEFAAADAALAGRFQRNNGSVSLPSFSAFEDGSARPPLGIQLTTKGGEFDDFHRFVDALKQDHDLVHAYNDLKRRFDGRSMKDYRAAKDEFIQTVLASLRP